MKLGDQLQATITALTQAGINGAAAQSAANLKKIKLAREAREFKVNQLQIKIVNSINIGRVPYEQITDYDDQSWFKAANKRTASNQDLWVKFVDFFRKEKLAVKIDEAHDGQGMQSWIVITVVPTESVQTFRGAK
jgi:hypothetical protein